MIELEFYDKNNNLVFIERFEGYSMMQIAKRAAAWEKEKKGNYCVSIA